MLATSSGDRRVAAMSAFFGGGGSGDLEVARGLGSSDLRQAQQGAPQAHAPDTDTMGEHSRLGVGGASDLGVCDSRVSSGGFVPASTFQDYAYTSQMFQNRQAAMDFSTANSLQNNNYLYGQSMAHGMASQAAAGYMDLAGSLCPPSSSSINQCSRMPPSSVTTPMYPWMAIVGKYRLKTTSDPRSTLVLPSFCPRSTLTLPSLYPCSWEL